MSKKSLCTPLSTLLRRSLTSFPQHFASNFSPQIKLSLRHAPSPFARDPACDYYCSLRRLGFCGKSLCSKSAEEIQRGCWSCRAVPHAAPFLVCDSCRCIQPVDGSVDYFDIFRVERKYDIEGENLEGKYKEWQKKLHPDLVHSKSQKERDFAAGQCARVIDAYRTLSKPLSRGIYLLKLYGVEVNEEQTISDPELLAEILEIREAVDEATNSEDLNRILSEMQEKMQNWSNAFGHAFQSQNFEEAKMAIRRMTYYSRVIDEVVKKL
ncbi:Iron-sulfur cluster co-chaperone protein HscB [Spatholobus suberectus]|nr:Iron-sulfur cluster co-chaperone protein HscB [Spatholobus suberectus]